MHPLEARSLSERHLAETLPKRWLHVQAVAARARDIAPVLGVDRYCLESAAWLHDIGYAPDVCSSGFHPLDGARFLRRHGVDEIVINLVAHHSAASVEAEERNLRDPLALEFPHQHGPADDGLWYCDMTTGPWGEPVTVDHRLAEISSRYGADHVVTRSINKARQALIASVTRVEEQLNS